MTTSLTRGQWAEELAQTYLYQQGLQPLEHNYRCKAGEIDLVMFEQSTLVFIEVRYRRSQRYGGSLESIDLKKQHRIMTTASHYLLTHQWAQNYPCRFDVVLISGIINNPQMHWIADAFRMEG